MLRIIQDHADHNAGGNDPELIVLHDTEGYPAGDLSILRSGGPYNVSVHFLVQPDGTVYQFLPLNVGGNHCGRSSWPGVPSPLNRHSIGIEVSHPPGVHPYPEAQLDALDALVAHIDAKMGRKLPIVGHRDIAPDRKTDPNPPFPLDAYKKHRAHEVTEEADVIRYTALCTSEEQAGAFLSQAKKEAAIDYGYEFRIGSHVSVWASFAEPKPGFESWCKGRNISRGSGFERMVRHDRNGHVTRV